jgi:hypothetical protein
VRRPTKVTFESGVSFQLAVFAQETGPIANRTLTPRLLSGASRVPILRWLQVHFALFVAACVAISILPGRCSGADQKTDEASAAEPAITPDDRDHWSFSPLKRPPIPDCQTTFKNSDLGTAAERSLDWPRNAIDSFVLDRLLKAGLVPAPEANRVTLIRRVTFDLIGLPPTPDEVDAFVTSDNPDAYEQLVERLLASPDYAVRWAQHWLDLARFAETDGFEHDKLRPDAWKYRDWVINALNEDLPFDEFALRQLAGDEIGDRHRVATGFLTCGPDMPDINLQDERRHSFLNEMTSTVGSVFLGLQVGCAECHDHKYDPISQRDFYRLRAFFDPAFPTLQKNQTAPLPQGNNTSTTSRLMIRGDFRRPGQTLEAAFVRIGNITDEPPRVQSDRRNLRTELARWITRPDQPLATRTLANRLWLYHFGVGLSQTPSDLGVVGDAPVHGELLDWLAAELPRQNWSLKRLHRLIVNSSTYRQTSRLPSDATPEQTANWQRSLDVDRLNLLHSRGLRKRLEGETIRDAMLAMSQQLSQRRGGPGIRPPLPTELVQTLLKDQWPVSKDSADFSRRSIYLFVRRNLRYPLFDAFDKPDTNATCSRRNVSTIAPQALMLLNSELSYDAAQAMAAIVMHDVGTDRLQQVRRVFQLAISRVPTERESRLAVEFLLADRTRLAEELPDDSADALDEAALTDLCLSAMNFNEFVYLD